MGQLSQLAFNLEEPPVFFEKERGYQRKSINRHSWRHYGVVGDSAEFMLDRTTDGSPPFFTLYEVQGDYLPREGARQGIWLPKTLKIDGQEYWGDGLTWKQAEALAFAHLAKLWEDE